MDAADRAILMALTQNARTPIKQLAQEAYLSSPAASARLERLEQRGIITGYQTILDYQKLGFHIMAFINISMMPDKRPGFLEFARGCTNVLECHHVTGNYTLIVKGVFKSTRDLESFVGQLQEYGSTQTQVVFSTMIEPRQIVE